MKARPILFNAYMVRALLDGRKTQTRRVMKPQPESLAATGDLSRAINKMRLSYIKHNKCPYGQPGDLLWVRETWASTEQVGEDATIVFRATDPDWADFKGWKWKPSIFMFRKSSRLTLKITDVRVERVKNISNDSAIAEGIQPGYEGWHVSEGSFFNAESPRQSYRLLWDSINDSWDYNPWVWVVEFEVIHKNIDEVLV